jgi:hypothetical protein
MLNVSWFLGGQVIGAKAKGEKPPQTINSLIIAENMPWPIREPLS